MFKVFFVTFEERPENHQTTVVITPEASPLLGRQTRSRSISVGCFQEVLLAVPKDQSRRRSMPSVNYQRSASDSYELLFKITDFVLIFCGILFVGSAIAHLMIWFYGLWNSWSFESLAMVFRKP